MTGNNPRDDAGRADEIRWETIARKWVLVLARHDDQTVTVRYPDGQELRVGQWILARHEQ